jgi:hypothetical protein
MLKAGIHTRGLTEVVYLPERPERTESNEFRHDKEILKKSGHYDCFIGNGYCEGQIELHHSVIEFSEDKAIDWKKVQGDYPNIDHVDDIDQMIPLCKKHHTGKYTGIHNTTYQAWLAQKYMTPEALAAFEAEIVRLKKNDIE